MADNESPRDHSLGMDFSGLEIGALDSRPQPKVPNAGTSQNASDVPAGGAPPMKRTLQISSVSHLLLTLPGACYSLICLMAVGSLPALANPALGFLTWLVPLAWFLSSALLFHPPVEKYFVRSTMGLREPTTRERRALEPLWNRVAQKAGVDPKTYMLNIEDSGSLNASAVAGHSVAVTTAALEHFQERHLEAVLAHELGHHLGGHTVAGLMHYWVALPGKFVNRIILRIYRVILAIIAAFSFWGWLLAILVVGGLALSALTMAPWLVLLFLIPLGVAAASRAMELAADKTAFQLGYGHDLTEVLEIFEQLDAEAGHSRQSRFAGLTATHPTPMKRTFRLNRMSEIS